VSETMRIYVAGSSAEIDRARAFIAAVREIPGAAITMDWPAFMEASGAADHELPIERLVEGAEEDLRGVMEADVVVLLAPTGPASRGLQTELGIAGCNATLAVGDTTRPVIARGLGLFGVLVNEWAPSDAEALAWLRGRVARRAA
jgi:hypothetical protein